MTRYLLDTNLISEAIKPRPSPMVLDWLGQQSSSDLFIASFTIAEVWRGILIKEPGRRKRDLETWFAGPDGPGVLFAGRTLSFDERAALEWARITAENHLAGRPRGIADMIIAATALANDCTVVTLNERDFSGVVDFLNPLVGLKP